MNCKLKCFTLVELLVVIAIISVLASTLLPVLTSVSQSARKVVCQSNLRQLGIISSLYTGDHNDYVVSIYEQPNSVSWPWFRFLWVGGYLPTPAEGTDPWSGASTKDNSIIKCPDIFQYSSNFAYWNHNVSYAANSRWVATDFPDSYQGTYRYRRLTKPKDYVSFIDYYSTDPTYRWHHVTFMNACMPHIDYRHLSEANWLAWDGHVESVCEETAWDDAWIQKHAWKR